MSDWQKRQRARPPTRVESTLIAAVDVDQAAAYRVDRLRGGGITSDVTVLLARGVDSATAAARLRELADELERPESCEAA